MNYDLRTYLPSRSTKLSNQSSSIQDHALLEWVSNCKTDTADTGILCYALRTKFSIVLLQKLHLYRLYYIIMFN